MHRTLCGHGSHPLRRAGVLIPFEQFLAHWLPEPPARVLEVGCGQGELTAALAVKGYDVLGIDPAAPAGPLFRRLTLDDLDEAEGSLQVVIAAQALHHIRDLDASLDRIGLLLVPEGLLLLDELAWDMMDEPTLEWLFSQHRAHAAARQGGQALSLEQLRADWDAEHLGLHGCGAMRAALDARFEERAFEWTPHLHRSLGGEATAVLEQALVDEGSIRPLGFRYAGAPRHSETQ